jgi:hypothetical protein
MNQFSRAVRRVLFAVFLSLVLAGALLSSRGISSTTAHPAAYSYWITYYSDATYTTEIGNRYVNCNGQGTLYGQSSVYQQSEIIDVCCRAPGGNGWVPC